MAIVGAVRLAATRTHAVAVALVVLAWLGAFGDACANPWNPLVVVLPLIAFLVLAALVANGSWRALPFAAVAGAFVAETHLSTVPVVIGIAVATSAVVGLRVRRGLAFGRRGKTSRIAGLAVLALAVAPAVVEELITRDGNITKLARFFAARTDPLRPFSAAFRDWALATSWLPDRLLSTSLLVEAFPEVIRSEPPLPQLSVTAFRATLALTLLAGVALGVALRRRDHVSVALLGSGGLGSVLSVTALRAIVGVNYIYLVFWTTAATTVLWMGVVCTIGKALSDLPGRSSRATLVRVGVIASMALTFAAALGVSSLRRGYLARIALSPTVLDGERDAYGLVRARLASTGETPVFHAHGAWHYGLGMLLEATKDGIDPRIVERDRWIFGRQTRGTEGLAHPLHIFVDTPDARVFVRDCLAKLATVGEIVIYTSPGDVEVCPAPAPIRPPG